MKFQLTQVSLLVSGLFLAAGANAQSTTDVGTINVQGAPGGTGTGLIQQEESAKAAQLGQSRRHRASRARSATRLPADQPAARRQRVRPGRHRPVRRQHPRPRLQQRPDRPDDQRRAGQRLGQLRASSRRSTSTRTTSARSSSRRASTDTRRAARRRHRRQHRRRRAVRRRTRWARRVVTTFGSDSLRYNFVRLDSGKFLNDMREVLRRRSRTPRPTSSGAPAARFRDHTDFGARPRPRQGQLRRRELPLQPRAQQQLPRVVEGRTSQKEGYYADFGTTGPDPSDGRRGHGAERHDVRAERRQQHQHQRAGHQLGRRVLRLQPEPVQELHRIGDGALADLRRS